MWSYLRMVPVATQTRRRRLMACGLAVVALTAAIMASPATAERPKMSVEFAAPTVRLAGPGALVYVRCSGSVASSCVGTLALKVPGGTHEAPFSIEAGAKRMVVVPLGSEQRLFHGTESAQAVAETMQSRGSSVRTARLLRIR
jgi:hypothetical protein